MKSVTKKQIAFGLLASTALMIVTATAEAGATGKVDLQLEQTNGKPFITHCRWSVRDERDHTEELEFYGSRLQQSMPEGRYIADVDCAHSRYGSAGFKVEASATTIKWITIRKF